MAVMFSNTRSALPTNGHIIEFKAGRTALEPGSAETKKRVVPDNKKGLVYVKQSTDQLIHFCWKDRETGALVDDLIIFPGDADFKEVKECSDGKVYMLKFKSSKEMRLYWLQDGAADLEKDLVQKVNDALNKPPPTRTPARGGNSERPSALANFTGLNINSDILQDYSGALGNLDQQQLFNLIQTLQGNGSDTLSLPPPQELTTPQPSTVGSSTGKINPNELSNILNNLGAPKKTKVSLTDAIANTTVQEVSKKNADRLKPLIASTENPADKELEETLRTPQLRQAADAFGNALQMGQLGPVLEQFGMNESVLEAANKGDLLEFAKQLTAQETAEAKPPHAEPEGEKSDDESKEPEPKKSRPDLEDMDVD